MSGVYNIISGIGLLILVFLFLNNGQETVAVIGAIGTSSVNTIRALQGEPKNK